ncbi:MAG TPA: class I SAM-dependent methyltransferase [Terriglobales bacterium]|jgi:tocopherol O-methyltransferase|nr:class I SAM-dependent methyltransferase [Terriglobales bacterium]
MSHQSLTASASVTVAQVREHYDSLAFIYRKFWGDHIHHGLWLQGDESPADAQLKMIDHCIDLLEVPAHAQVLDVGCGHGGTLVHLAQRLSCSGTGITISPKQARLAREHAAKARLQNLLNFEVADADSFDFSAAAFDLVWTMESSEHFGDKSRYFSGAAKALRTEGKLLLAAWTGGMEQARVREVARAFLCSELWTASKYRSAIESAGLEVARCEDLSNQVIRTWEICRHRARSAAAVVKLLPRAAREFVEGIDVILDAFRSGDLTYTVLVAQK